jgi:hypothetical protein
LQVIGEFEWGLHIPATIEGQSIAQLSMVLYDPISGLKMICADLEVDRQLDGVVDFVNQDLVENVPSVCSFSWSSFQLLQPTGVQSKHKLRHRTCN